MPYYATRGAAGCDIIANETTYIPAGGMETISTGLFMEIPDGYELQIRPRSGMVFKNKLMVANSPGTIDSDYRGEIKIILYNMDTKFGTVIRRGERIVQGVVAPISQVEFRRVEILSDTQRGDGGLGSTGR
jgi:dUTP pyrophosphatase